MLPGARTKRPSIGARLSNASFKQGFCDRGTSRFLVLRSAAKLGRWRLEKDVSMDAPKFRGVFREAGKRRDRIKHLKFEALQAFL
jgi:hypothetical protein